MAVRTGVVEVEKENLIMKEQIASLRSLYNDAMAKVRCLESMLLNAESANESLQRKFDDYNKVVDECNAVVSTFPVIELNSIPVRKCETNIAVAW